MAAFSLGMIWEETIAFVRREFTLLTPVALATFGVAQFLFSVAVGGDAGAEPVAEPTATQALLLLPTMLLLLLGNLAVSLIVLVPGRRIGESLQDAFRRLPGAVMAMLLLGLIMMGIGLLVLVTATVGAMTFGIEPNGFMRGIILLLMVPLTIIMVRMLLLVPVLAMERHNPFEAIRRAWTLSRRRISRVFAIFLLTFLLAILLGIVQLAVVGSLAKLAGLVIGAPLANLLSALVNAGMQAVFAMAAATFVAIFYRNAVAEDA